MNLKPNLFRTHRVDFSTYFDDIVGVTLPENGQVETVVLSISAELLPYLETKPLHGSQKSLKDPSCEGLLTFNLIINYELIAKLLSLGDGIKIIRPLHLAKTIQQKIQQMALRYQTSANLI